MTLAGLLPLLPFILLGALPAITMLFIAVHRSHLGTLCLTLLGFSLAALSLPLASSYAPLQMTPLLILDGYWLFYFGLLLAASFVVALFAYPYFRSRPGDHEEVYLLLQLAALGATVLGAANHFASFFLGLEILTVSLYAMLAYLYWQRMGVEAGLKYLVLAGASTAFLAFGMALVYGELGTMEFPGIRAALASSPPTSLLLAGLAMMAVGIGFELAVVPFHMWTPDVYEGAPAPVTAFVATVSKGAVFALLLRLLGPLGIASQSSIFWMLALVAAASMLAGNLLALRQRNVKRVLAYSSIAHMGYLLVALLSGGALAVAAGSFYLASYFVTTLGAFGVVSLLSSGTGALLAANDRRDFDDLESYRGLAFHRPWLSAIFTGMLFSLAGLPLTAGFVGKFFLVAAGAGAGLWWLLVVLVLGSVISLAYYLRIAMAVYSPSRSSPLAVSRMPVSLLGSAALAALTLALVWLGVYPAPLVGLIQAFASSPAG